MQFSTKAIAVVAALVSSAAAFDVYSEFYTSAGMEITSTTFDVSDGGCFSVSPAAYITFTQHDTTGTANGPYCLRAYTQGGCAGGETSQQFGPVKTDGSTQYTLANGVADAASFSWDSSSCP